MKQESNPARHAAWLFLAAPAFLAIPAHGQEATPQAATPPPPVVRTVPQAATAPETLADAPTEVRGTDPNSATRIAPGAADVVDDARIAARAEQRTQVRREPRRAPPVARAAASTAAAAAPVATPAPTPAPSPAALAEPATPPAAQPATAVPAEPAATTTQTNATQATDGGGVPPWPLAAIVAVIVAVGAFFLLRRRKANAYDDADVCYEEPAYAEPVPVAAAPVAAVAPVAAPVAAAVAMTQKDEPVAAGLADELTVTDAPAEDVAALTGGAAAVHDRPWLELAMRPVRAGTSADEALVEIELTVANSGSVKAEDVRVSTFMLTDAHASEMERLLVDAPADAAIDPVTIEPGEGTRIDATLAALKADLGGEGRFTPVVVADARYRLPDGSEGRTSASFVVGVSDEEGGALIPIDLADRVMREDVEARLHGEPEHA